MEGTERQVAWSKALTKKEARRFWREDILVARAAAAAWEKIGVR